MTISNFGRVGIFLVNILVTLYVLAFMLRFLLQLVRADFYNPVSQALIKVTSPVLKPLRKVIPGYWGMDLAAMIVMFLLEVIKIVVIYGVIAGLPLNASGVILISLRDLFVLLLQVYFWSILIQALLSWFNPGTYNPLTSILTSLNEPLLKRARRVLPPMGGLDFSPILVMIILQALRILIMSA